MNPLMAEAWTRGNKIDTEKLPPHIQAAVEVGKLSPKYGQGRVRIPPSFFYNLSMGVMESQKKQINTFVSGNILDIATTGYAVGLGGFSEVGPYASSTLISDPYKAMVVKVAVSAIIVGLYALSQAHPGRFTRSVETAMKSIRQLCGEWLALMHYKLLCITRLPKDSKNGSCVHQYTVYG